MGEIMDKSLDEALAYMCNLPSVYVNELELNKSVFFTILSNLSDVTHGEGNDFSTSKYLSLQFNVVQKYCSGGFPPKYVYGYYSQYCRTINAAILIYYRTLRSKKLEQSEYENLFGKFFLDEPTLKDLENEDLILACVADVKNRIKKDNIAEQLQKKFEENWREKRASLLEKQIAYGQVIRDHFTPVEDFERLTDQGATLKRALNFLDKLETESHDRCSEDAVLVPYEEYHALHELLSENPWEKGILRENHAKIVTKLERILSGQDKKQN